MFTTCIHCNGALGQNEAFEVFPVGERLAFDARNGRLWVVCRHCDRWNLSPLEERWEAVEAMEGRYRDSRLRVSTDNIGLARLREGVDLIRIGEPQRPEMAAWRYGDQFGRRRRRQMLVTSAVVGSAAAIIGGIAAAGVSVGSFAGVYANGGLWDVLINGRPGVSIGKVKLPDGQLVDVQRKHARMSSLVRAQPGGPLQLRLEHVGGNTLVTGDDAMRIASRLMSTVNRFGGSRAQVQEAVAFLEDAGSPEAALVRVQQRHGWNVGDKQWGVKTSGSKGWVDIRRTGVPKLKGALHTLDVRERLAIEMALHDEAERAAMQGELAQLEAAWREADEIAKIADDLLTPASVHARLGKLHDD